MLITFIYFFYESIIDSIFLVNNVYLLSVGTYMDFYIEFLCRFSKYYFRAPQKKKKKKLV